MNEEILGKMATGPSGRHLGRISQIGEERFCVDVEEAHYWLPRDVIFSVEENMVTVIFEPNALERYVIASEQAAPPSERAG